ncbi:MAG: CHAT domain-containing protein, partial [Synechococcaceae cyanobacterium]|nr:CHAT domain-containing protein [Synechococcaceae cyanobacterium]
MLRGAVLTSLALLLSGSGTAWAQVAAGGLGTRVNGTALGRCSAGVCSVQGGSVAGPNLFHRFSQFDTRSGIQRVDLDSRGRSNVVVGVSHPAGSFFNAPLRLSGAANLFWLSPGGLWLGNGARFQGATSLLLSTAPSLRLGGGAFNAVGGLADRLGAGADAPSLDVDGLATGSGPIVLAGGRLTVDRQLLLHSGAGPILTAPGERSVLQAGGSVQLSGGQIALQGLDVQAGTSAADDQVRIRSGPMVGGGLGGLELSDASLRGSRIQLEGPGGLVLQQVEARAGGAAEPGFVGLLAGTKELTSAAWLNAVELAGGEVFIGARGPLEAHHLRVAAGEQGGSGTLQMIAGPPANETSSLRLTASNLQGRNVVISAQGASELENVRASAGAAGGVWITTEAAQDSSPGPIALRAVELRGDTIKVSANGPLTANGLTIGGRSASSPAERVQILANGDLTASQLDAGAETILVEAHGVVRLSDGGALRGIGGMGQVQLDALRPAAGFSQGQLDLQGITIESQTITGRADRVVNLRQATLRAGQPGTRGLVRLETGSAQTPRAGTVSIEGSQLEGQWLLVRTGAIELSDSTFQAPKGIIQLEAEGGDIQLKNSQLDVGVHLPLDLRRDVVAKHVIGKTVSINQEQPDPAIGLFATGHINLRDGSKLLANQDLNAIRRANPGFAEADIRLLDNSGVIIMDAGRSLQMENSRIEADATDNLAGDILLRSQSSDSQDGISLRNAWISASGGAGSGDIRLQSAGGITSDNSHLLALANLRFEDPDQPGQASPNLGFAGGEITLTNSSRERGITILDSQLNAEQSLSEEVVAGYKLTGNGADAGFFFDSNDDNDNFYTPNVYGGGIISILSDAGLQIRGAKTLISVGGTTTDAQRRETVGGILRLGNSSARHSIDLDAKASLSAISNPVGELVPSTTTTMRYDARGRINIWSQGPINLRDVSIDTSINPQAGYRSPEDTWEPTLSLFSASRITIENSTLLSLDPENISKQDLQCPLGCDRPDWNPDNHREFLDDSFWGPGRDHYGLQFTETGSSGDTTLERIIDRQKSQFLDKPEDWLIRAGQAPITLIGPPEPNLAAEIPTTVNSQDSAPLQANTNITIEWPDSGRFDQRALLPSPRTLASPPALPAVSDSSLMASDLKPLSRADAEQLFTADQDKAVKAALPFLTPARPAGSLWSVDTLQDNLRRAMAQTLASGPKGTRPLAYRPAILQISLSHKAGMKLAQINHILLAANGDLQGWQSQVDAERLQQSVRRFQQQLSGLDDLGDGRVGQDLASVLIGPVISELRRLGINALLLSLDRGLQGIPFAALPLGGDTLADLTALTVTPALALTDLTAPPLSGRARVVIAGSSRFSNGLAPLPMARQEVEQLASLLPQPIVLLDRDFSSQSLLRATQQEPVSILHIASHAEFRDSPHAVEAKIYTNDGEISVPSLARSLASPSQEIGLFVLNACRTSAGNELRELGITGLALQTGAHSALGNLWYVDDVASTAFSLQFYRNLQKGLRRDQALQATQRQFRGGEIRVRGSTIINANNEVLVAHLNPSQQRQLDGNLSHPYYWSGTLLSGSPW